MDDYIYFFLQKSRKRAGGGDNWYFTIQQLAFQFKRNLIVITDCDDDDVKISWRCTYRSMTKRRNRRPEKSHGEKVQPWRCVVVAADLRSGAGRKSCEPNEKSMQLYL